MTLEPLGEVGANFSLQLSSRTQLTKINNKKVIAENQCEKHKESRSLKISNIYRQNAHNMSYMVINDQNKFLAWDSTKQKSTMLPNQQDGWICLSFTISLSNSKTAVT